MRRLLWTVTGGAQAHPWDCQRAAGLQMPGEQPLSISGTADVWGKNIPLARRNSSIWDLFF